MRRVVLRPWRPDQGALRTRTFASTLLTHAYPQGVGFDDFVKDRRVAAGVPPKGVGRRKVEPTCFDAFMKNDTVVAGTAPRGPVTDFDRFLKRHVTSVRCTGFMFHQCLA